MQRKGQMQQRINCAICGSANAPGQKFCGSCGSPLSSVCPNCGAALNPGDKFCGNCGAQLPAMPPQSSWQPPQQQQTSYMPPQQQYVPPQQPQTPPQQRQYAGTQRDYGQTSYSGPAPQQYEQPPPAYGTGWETAPRRSMMPLVVLLVFLIVALGGFAWWAFMGNPSWSSGGGGLQITHGPFYNFLGDNTTATRDGNITFETNIQSIGKVEYGPDDNYGNTTAWETTYTKSHSIPISALSPATSFHYRVVIKDKNNNEVETTDYTFRTPQ